MIEYKWMLQRYKPQQQLIYTPNFTFSQLDYLTLHNMALWEYTWLGSGTTKWLYHLNGNSNDSSGNANNWTATNITWVSWIKGSGAASFNGSSSVIATSSAITTWTSATFSFWLYKTNDNDQSFFNEWDYNAASLCFFSNSDHKINYRFWSTNGIATWADPVVNNSWNNIICTHTWTSGIIYINWKVAWSGTVNAKNSSWTYFMLWKLWQLSLYWLNWYMDEVIIENRAWTQKEVQKYYTYSKWYFGTL